jgi:hypothetical protein
VTTHEKEVMDTASDFGGESACFAHLVCGICGAVTEPYVHSSGIDLNHITIGDERRLSTEE